MPVVTIDTAGRLDRAQKEEIIEKCTEAIVHATGKDAKYVYVKINEIDRENFGIGGKTLG